MGFANLAEFEFITAFIVFFAEFSYWFLTVFFINNVIDGNPFKVGAYAAAVTFHDRLSTFLSVKNFTYTVAACLGALVGAILASQYDIRMQRRKNKKH